LEILDEFDLRIFQVKFIFGQFILQDLKIICWL